MKLSVYEQCRKKRLTLQYAIIGFAIVLLYSAVCQPVFIWAKNDIIIRDSMFPVIWEMLSNIVNYLFYCVSFVYMLYLASRFTLRACKPFFAIYASASAVMYAVSLLSAVILKEISALGLGDLLDILMYVGFDALQMAIASFIAWKLLHGKQERAMRAYLFALSKDPNAEPVVQQWLPFASLFDLKNELMRTAFFAAMIPAAWRILGRLYYDIFFWGLPVNLTDALWMVFYYLADVALFFLGYLLIVLLLNRIDSKEDRRQRAYQSAFS